MKAEFGGIMGDFYGNTKVGFDISGKINRQDFGLTWGAVTEAGGVVVSDEVRLAFNIQVSKQAEFFKVTNAKSSLKLIKELFYYC